MRILLTGSQGMLGQDVIRVFGTAGHDVIATDRDELDITDAAAVRRVVVSVKPDVIINAAAYNLVDKVEDPEVYPLAYAINALGPGNLAVAAQGIGALMVHYSTDYVFAGDKPEGYVEDDAPAPLSKYGETKLAGEEAVRAAGGRYYVCRTSKLFGIPGVGENAKESFVALMLRLAKMKPELSIVDDEVGCPTYTRDLAAATLRLIDTHSPPGTYHLVNSGPPVTWYAFAEEIFALAGVTTPRKPVPSEAFPRLARLPKFAALRNTKTDPLPSRAQALRYFLGV